MSHSAPTPADERRRRRQRRSLITIGLLVLLLFFAFWYAYSYYRADSPGTADDPAPTCQSPSPGVVLPAQVQVRVYNASNKNGLAASTGSDLTGRGFSVVEVANDPTDRKAPAVAEVRHGPDGLAQAQALLAVLPEGSVLVDDQRTGAIVDLALGAGYTSLAPSPSPTPGQLPWCPPPSSSLPIVSPTS